MFLSPEVASYFVAGGCAGAASRTVVSPLERLKIIQSYKGVWRSLSRMWTEEGFRGFMRGNGINCSTYPLDLVRSRLSIATASITLVAAPHLGTASLSALPLKPALASAYHTSSSLASSIASSVPASMYSKADLTIYGMTLKIMREEGGFLRGVVTPPGKSSVARKLSCGALAGSISQTLTYPFDVLRRKMQVTGMQGGSIKYSGAIDALRSILRVEGVAGLYRGLWPNLLKVAPSIATSFFTYELVGGYSWIVS
ncbi:mitochondrial carrier domain-containing protein [Crassisporium funariophilum]|nr:mitochondrial carrier domain-containing protein [Crassisporium funariophilum]